RSPSAMGLICVHAVHDPSGDGTTPPMVWMLRENSGVQIVGASAANADTEITRSTVAFMRYIISCPSRAKSHPRSLCASSGYLPLSTLFVLKKIPPPLRGGTNKLRSLPFWLTDRQQHYLEIGEPHATNCSTTITLSVRPSAAICSQQELGGYAPFRRVPHRHRHWSMVVQRAPGRHNRPF